MSQECKSSLRGRGAIVFISALIAWGSSAPVVPNRLAAGQQSEPEPSVGQEIPDRAELEDRFEATLSGTVLIGSFTTDGSRDGEALSEDRYTIEKVTKGKNDYWIFEASVQYGGRDAKFRMPLEVRWAGDTPVITITGALVPGLGVFTARVLIYNNQYAGTWSAGADGGQMFGRIEKLAAKTSPADGEASDTN